MVDLDALRKRVSAVFAVIEVPSGKTGEASPAAADLAAWNGRAMTIITGSEKKPADVNPDQVDITLRRNGELISKTSGGVAAGGQYATLLQTVNNLVSRGYTIKKEHVITNGALGDILPLETGAYRADYGPLGAVEFEVVDSD